MNEIMQRKGGKKGQIERSKVNRIISLIREENDLSRVQVFLYRHRIYFKFFLQLFLHIYILNQSAMSFTNDVKPKNQHLSIQFQFINFKRTLKMNVNPRVSIKSLRPLFANKFNSDFAHMNIKVVTKGARKEMIDTQTPFYQIGHFSLLNQPQYTLEVEIEYQGG